MNSTRIDPAGRPSSRRAAILAALVLAAVVLPITGDAVACASTHGKPFLKGFPDWPNVGSPFYPVREGDGQVTVPVGVTPGHCVVQTGSSASYTTEIGSATSEDFTGKSGVVSGLCDDVDTPSFCQNGHKPTESVQIEILSNASPADRAVESFMFRLSNGSPDGLAEPSAAPVHIIDRDAPTRASLEPTVDGSGAVRYQRTEFGFILIPVFLAGPPGQASVHFTVEADPAAPAEPGVDFEVATPSPLTITAPGRAFVRINIIGDKLSEGDESVTITLQPGPGYAVAEPSSTTFTILDNEENIFPVSRFHHPKNRWKYNKADYRIREFHVFATDEGGSGVVAAELALRRNLKNGRCAWKTKSGWQRKDCQNRTWLPTKFDDVGELFYYRMNQLKPSVKTKIKDYTAFARAIDGAGNVEKEFTKKRNMNTFEIRRSGKTQKSKA
jgi:hypothetical protein